MTSVARMGRGGSVGVSVDFGVGASRSVDGDLGGGEVEACSNLSPSFEMRCCLELFNLHGPRQ
jgi:hypothetical protein